MKYRILFDGENYKVQEKGWVFWHDFTRHVGYETYRLSLYKTKEAAKEAIEKDKQRVMEKYDRDARTWKVEEEL